MEIKGLGLGYGGLGNVAGAPAPVPVQTSTQSDGADQELASEVAMGTSAPVSTQQTQQKGDKQSGEGDSREKKEATDDQIKKAVSEINKRANETEAVFGVHEKTNRITIKIVDKKTKDVIREVPAEKTLDLIAKAWELAGLMVDEKR